MWDLRVDHPPSSYPRGWDAILTSWKKTSTAACVMRTSTTLPAYSNGTE